MNSGREAVDVGSQRQVKLVIVGNYVDRDGKVAVDEQRLQRCDHAVVGGPKHHDAYVGFGRARPVARDPNTPTRSMTEA